MCNPPAKRSSAAISARRQQGLATSTLLSSSLTAAVIAILSSPRGDRSICRWCCSAVVLLAAVHAAAVPGPWPARAGRATVLRPRRPPARAPDGHPAILPHDGPVRGRLRLSRRRELHRRAAQVGNDAGRQGVPAGSAPLFHCRGPDSV